MCALTLALGGCTSDEVPIDVTRVHGRDAPACRALVRALPDTVSGQSRRPVDPAGVLGAAWGDPPIVLRCGVGRPAGYTRFASCDRVNGIDWFTPESTVMDQSADAVLTTLGRRPAVEVTVPASYRPPAAVMVDLARVLHRHTARTRGCL